MYASGSGGTPSLRITAQYLQHLTEGRKYMNQQATVQAVTPEQIAEAFGVNCPRKNWAARVVRVSRGTEQVAQISFRDRQGLITLVYDCDTGEYRRFHVTFEKALASWGDYNNAIAKGLHTVLMALQAGGLPFEAPASFDRIMIRTRHASIGGAVTVEYEKGTDPGTDIF